MEKHLEKFDNQYSVTDNGIVYSLKGNKKELKGKVTNAGYREVILSHKGNKKYILVHRLFAGMEEKMMELVFYEIRQMEEMELQGNSLVNIQKIN